MNIPSQRAKKYEIASAIVAADAFVAHSEVFINSLPADINLAQQVAVRNIGGLIASATNLALGVELYLKVLRMQGGLSVPHTHNLLSLYSEIHDDKKHAIEDLYERSRTTIAQGTSTVEIAIGCGSVSQEAFKSWDSLAGRPTDNSFRSVLERSSDAFLTWRYHHEGGQEGELMTYSYEFRHLQLAGRAIRAHLGVVKGLIGQRQRGTTPSNPPPEM